MLAFPRELLEEFQGGDAEARLHQRQHLNYHLERYFQRHIDFVDDEVQESASQRARALVAQAQTDWEQEVLKCEQLLLTGVDASSTDNNEQNINNTLQYDHQINRQRPWEELFWSSTGSDDEDAREWLVYKLKHPICALHSVKIQVFRARYQRGEPIYPPKKVMFEVGPTLNSLHPVTGWLDVRVSCAGQTFHIPSNACVGRYLRINFQGKLQKQLEDMRRYLAIRRVWAFGWALEPQHIGTFKLKQLQNPRASHVYNGTYGSALVFGAGRQPSLPTQMQTEHDTPDESGDHSNEARGPVWVLPPLPQASSRATEHKGPQ